MQTILDITDPEIRVDPFELEEHLSWLEESLSPDTRDEVETLQYETFLFHETTRIPVLVSTRNDVAHQTYGKSSWPVYPFQRMWYDPAAMLLNELFSVYESIILNDDKVFTIRPNLSQLFIPAFFGASGTTGEQGLDEMPYINRTPDRDTIERMIEQKIDVKSSFMAVKFRETVAVWKKIIAPYPRLKKYLHIALPDLQGPFNVYFLMRGVEAYIDLFDNPGLVDRFMGKITEVIGETILYLSSILGETGKGYCWNYGYPGLLRNVDDNSTLISREQYLRFVHPWNARLTERCGGGIHHYCGDGSHIAEDIMSIPGICGLNFGNPEMQDLEFVTALSKKTQTVLLWDRVIPAGEMKKMPPGGFILKAIVPDIEAGRVYLQELGR